MATDDRRQQLEDLLRATGAAHHEAFIAVDGADPEWPLWYADYLVDRLGPPLGATITKSELVYLLLHAGKTQAREAPGSDWAGYTARFLLQRYG